MKYPDKKHKAENINRKIIKIVNSVPKREFYLKSEN